MSSPFIQLDGRFFRQEEKIFTAHDFEYLLFSETLRAIRSQFMFWDEHLALIDLQFQLLNQPVPEVLTNGARELKRQLERTLVKNKLFKSARIDVCFFKKNSNTSFLIKTEEIPETGYAWNTDGITLGVFGKISKANSPLSALRLGSENYWQILRAASLTPSTELILQNAERSLLEVPGSNLFLINDNTVSTPAPETGVFISPARHAVRQICQKTGLNFQEESSLSPDDLLQADEVFLADDLQGIRWVKAFGMKRYFNKTVKIISDALNRELVQ
ncbi:aminotransferase class IV [Gaoshiqia sediminis]|uniref:Aminotransferase class IV n=1 Tax=Gaoshiqia sediminis TaxID=2986998 RepID=A0AA41Y8I2_9BACT|nr:aminotransferase class IV [Gaoshiqia sediminis]MCW0481150.1 aminotransferase class IV [Gaoshiqia sediminis]